MFERRVNTLGSEPNGREVDAVDEAPTIEITARAQLVSQRKDHAVLAGCRRCFGELNELCRCLPGLRLRESDGAKEARVRHRGERVLEPGPGELELLASAARLRQSTKRRSYGLGESRPGDAFDGGPHLFRRFGERAKPKAKTFVEVGTGAFNGLFLGLGAIALLVGAIGVANIMIISVLERRSEIGLRRALGATRAQIRIQFLAEAILLALLGGVAGIGAGALATTIYAHTRHWTTVIPALAWGAASPPPSSSAPSPASSPPSEPPASHPPTHSEPHEPPQHNHGPFGVGRTGFDGDRDLPPSPSKPACLSDDDPCKTAPAVPSTGHASTLCTRRDSLFALARDLPVIGPQTPNARSSGVSAVRRVGSRGVQRAGPD
jgi:hypothetical protein